MSILGKKNRNLFGQKRFPQAFRERPSARALALAFGVMTLAALSNNASADWTWTPSGVQGADGGGGTWDTSSSSWDNGTNLQPWNNNQGYSAVFGSTAGTVTVSDTDNITVQNINFISGGYTIAGGPLSLYSNSSTISTFNGGSDTINSDIQGASALVINGGGTLVLGGNNTYSGGTSVNGGATLQVASDANLGGAGGTLTLGDGTSLGTLAITGSIFSSARDISVGDFGGMIDTVPSGTSTLSGVLSGTGSLTFMNTGKTILTGNNTLSGGINIADGTTVQVGDGGSSGTLGSGNVANSGALIFDRDNSYTYAGVISGTGTVEQVGSGTTILTGNNTYTGLTTISGGILQVGDNGASGAIVGDILNNGQLHFSRSNNYLYDGVISGSGSVRKYNAGTTILRGANTYTGGTYIYGGVLSVSSDANLGGTSGLVYLNGGTLNASTGVTTARDVTLGAGGGVFTGSLTENGEISGSGKLYIRGGTVTLGGTNTYTGGTYISNNATLVVSHADNLGAGPVELDSSSYIQATLRVTDSFDLTQGLISSGDHGPNTVVVDSGKVLTVDSVVSGYFPLTFSGGGRTILNGNNTVYGLAIVGGATLQVSADANLGHSNSSLSIGGGTLATTASFSTSRGVSLYGGGAAFNVADSTALTLNGGVSGNGSPLTKNGLGTLILAGNNSYNQGTIINSGIVQVGDGGTSGTLGTGNVTNNSALVFKRSDSYTYAGSGYAGVISGTGTVEQAGSGTTILTGSNSYKGATTVSAGTLYVNGNQSSATGNTTVASGATLGGKGTIGGNVTVSDGGIFAPGDVGLPSTLTINGNLSLDSGAILNYRFGQADTVGGALNDLAEVNGNLILDGTINVTVPDGGAFDPGIYRVFNYSGSLTDNGLALGTIPAGNSVTVQTSVANQVNLVNTLTNVSFWDGSNPGLFDNNTVNGGDGTWNSGLGANSSWTDIDGVANAAYPNGTFAIFEAAPGTVTVDNSGDQVVASGMQFASNGYLITGDAITLVDKNGPGCVTTLTCTSTIRVGDGTATGAGYTATVASVLQGDTRLVKADRGTLILTADNTYTENTTVAAGTLQLGDGGASGSVQGDILDNANLAVNRSDIYTYGGNISGTGTFHQAGSGTTVLTGANSYSGTTTISNGVLQVGDGSTTGTLGGGSVVNNAKLVFNRSNNVGYGGNISGTGLLEQAGTGTTILTGNASHTGGTLISAGTLQIGNGQNYGTIAGSIVDNGNLAFNRSDAYTYGGTISGTGSVSQIGASSNSRTILTGTNTYTGGTHISAGTLQASSDANLGDAAGSVTFTGGTLYTVGGFTTSRDIIVNGDSSLVVDSGHTLTLEGAISGSRRLYLHNGNYHLTGTAKNGELYVTNGAKLIVDSSSALAVTGQLIFGGPPSSNNAGGTLQTTADMTIDSNISAVWTNAGSSTALTFLTDAGTTLTLNGNLNTGGTSSSQIVKTGGGTLIENSNSVGPVYSRILQGTVQIGDGGTKGGWGGGSTAISAGAVLAVNRSDVYTLNTQASGAGEFRQIGTGTTILTNNENYTGGTTISAGTLQLGNGGTTGSVTGNIIDNANLAFKHSDTYTFDGAISGTGALQQIGTGTLVLTGTSTYEGGTDIKAGTLQVSSDANLGDAAGLLTFSGGTLATVADLAMTRAAVFNGTGMFDVATNTTLTMAGPASGAGGLTKTGFGTLILSGANTYAGATDVLTGALYVNGDQSGATGTTTVASGAILGGTGTIGGDVIIANGGNFNPGLPNDGGTLTIDGNLTFNSTSNLNYQFGQVGGEAVNSLAHVKGNLIAGGQLNVTAPTGGTFDPGVYRVFDYDGTLTDNGLQLGSTPASTTLTLQTGVAHQINLVNTTGQRVTFWDGGDASKYNNNLIDGGDGVWKNVIFGDPLTGWATAAGDANAIYENKDFDVFEGTAGTVTVDNSGAGGVVVSSGMQFASDGYVINGDFITLYDTAMATTSGATTIRVGDGSAAGAGYTATIDAILQGDTRLVKTDEGTLILTAANAYTGGTAINGGTLQVASDDNLGATPGALSFDGGKLAASAGFTTARATTLNSNGGTIGVLNSGDTLTMDGVISGAGALTKTDDGTLVLTANNSYAGGTEFNGGTVQITRDNNLGAASGPLSFDGGTLATDGTFTTNRVTTLNAGGGTIDTATGTTLTMGKTINGAGALTKADNGILVLGADNSYTGGTVISGGTLQVGNSSTAGTLGSGDVTDNGTLTFARSDSYSYGGKISGTGSVAQNGSGTTTLSGVNTYSGSTTINAGKLIATSGSALSSNSVNNLSTLQLDFAGNSALANKLVGTGSLIKTGTGTATLTGADSSEGAVSVNAGTLDFAQSGAFNATSLTTAGNATTSIDDSATVVLSGALTQAANATLDITTGATPYRAITADTASIDGTLIVRNYSSVPLPASASGLANTQLSVLHTTNGITGDFTTVDLGGATSPVDYLTLSHGVSSNGLDYNVGYTLKWLAGTTLGNGTFTLANASDTFNVDVALADQAASATGWDGKTLTKAGAGTLILSSVNTYTGDTLVNAGTLRAGADNAFASSANVTLASGATLDLNGTNQQANNLSGAGNVTLASGALTVNSNADTTLSGVVSGTGSLTKTGAEAFTLTGTNTYTGGTTISDGEVIASNSSALGTGTVTNNAELTLNFATDQTFTNQLAGSGLTRVNGAGITTITGANSGYTGNWQIDRHAALAGSATTSNTNLGTGAVNIATDGILDAGTTGLFTFNNQLTGDGLLNASNGGNAFSFGTNAGADFAGTVALTNNTFDLSGNNTTALTNATLSLGSGNVTTVGAGQQNIGNLTFAGGTAVFDATIPADNEANGIITTSGNLNVAGSGTVRINQPANGWDNSQPVLDTQLSLLEQDDANILVKLVKSNGTVTGAAGNLTLTDASNQTISNGQVLDITQGGITVAEGTYDYRLTTSADNDGLYVNYGLTQLNLIGTGNNALILASSASASGTATDLSAKLTGSGDLTIATAPGNSVTLSNSDNDYGGATRVTSGTLKLGADHALGATSGLTIANGAAADINGKTQTVGDFTGQAGSTLNLNGGNLTISDGGSSAGALTGAGNVNITGGTLAVTGSNTGLTAGVSIASGAAVTLDNVAGLGNSGTITDDGTLDIAASGTFTKNVAGAGAVNLTGTADLTLGGSNTLSGSWNVAGGTKLTASSQSNLSTAAVNNAGTFDVNTSTNWTLTNALTGAGVFIKDGSGTLTISQANSMSGPTNINNGTLSLTDADGVGSGVVTIATGAGLDLNLATAQTFDNQIAGTGTTSVTGALATITGDNSSYTGNWRISGQAAVADSATSSNTNLGTGTVNIVAGGILNANTTSTFSFDNALTGTGTLNAANNGGAFSFGMGAGTDFAGTVALAGNTFDLSSTNTAALTNATLSLGSGNITTVGTGNQTIGGLKFAGGKAVFDATVPDNKLANSTITTSGNLDVSGTGTVQVNLPASGLTNDLSQSMHLPLLEQDDANALVQLVKANGSVTGSGGSLTLVDANGNVISDGKVFDLTQNGTKVAEGTYDYRLSTGTATDGLYVNYGLTQVNLIGMGTDALALTAAAGATGSAADLSAKVTGSGDLAIEAGVGNTLTLSNSSNDYSGLTDVRNGTLKMAGDNVLGQTSAVNVAADAAFDTDGYSQSIGALNTAAGATATIAAGSTLTITNAQRSAGDSNGGAIDDSTLFGGGTLVIDPSTVRVNGTQADYTGTMQVTGGSTLIVNTANVFDNAQGVQLVTDADTLIFGDLSSFNSAWTGVPTGTSAMNISGLGTVNVQDGSDVTLTGANASFAGRFVIDTPSTLRASAQDHLGTASIQADGTFNAIADSDWAMSNLVTGAGTVLKTGAGLLKVGDDTLKNFTGLTDIEAGTLQIGEYAGDAAQIGGAVQIAAGAQLGGTGTIIGDVENTGTITSLNALGAYGNNDVSTLTIAGVLTNSGTVNLAGANVGNTLTVGGIIGQGGTFVLNTVLGNDSSLTDRIIVNGGSVTGSSSLRILNAGGTGAQTATGILLVQAANGATTTADAFSLDPQSSGYRSTDGTLAAGAYEYSLVRGGQGGDANSWYLTSIDPSSPKDHILRPEAGIYGTNATVARNMFMMTLHDREGYAQGAQGTAGAPAYAGWLRINGGQQNNRVGGDALATQANTATVQLGIDLLHHTSPKLGSFYAGLMGGWGQSTTDATSRQRTMSKASGKVNGYSAGLYGTWYQQDFGETGAYIDTWAQYNWFNNSVQGGGLPQEKYDSHAFTASVEAGYSFLLMNRGQSKLFIEPQAQLAYVSYGMDNHVEQGGTSVRFEDGNGVVGRVGARLSSLSETGAGRNLRAFVELNYWYNHNSGQLWMGDDLVPAGAPRSFAEIKPGIVADLSKNLEISAQLTGQVGSHHYDSVGGQISVKYNW